MTSRGPDMLWETDSPLKGLTPRQKTKNKKKQNKTTNKILSVEKVSRLHEKESLVNLKPLAGKEGYS